MKFFYKFQGKPNLLGSAFNVIACAFALLLVQAHSLKAETLPADSIKELRFSDILRTPIGSRGIELSDSLVKEHGKTVRIIGYMVQQEVVTPGQFLLSPQPVQMSQHADGEADDLPATTVLVGLDENHKTWSVAHVCGLVAVQGILKVGRQEASDGRVSWLRLQLEPEAVRSMNSLELAGYLHNQHFHR
jgi:hypothetical protein